MAERLAQRAEANRETETVTYEPWGETFLVVKPHGGNVAYQLEVGTRGTPNEKGEGLTIIYSKFQPAALVGTVLDPSTKQPIWGPGDEDKILALPEDLRQLLTDAVDRLKPAQGEGASSEAKKDSGETSPLPTSLQLAS